MHWPAVFFFFSQQFFFVCRRFNHLPPPPGVRSTRSGAKPSIRPQKGELPRLTYRVRNTRGPGASGVAVRASEPVHRRRAPTLLLTPPLQFNFILLSSHCWKYFGNTPTPPPPPKKSTILPFSGPTDGLVARLQAALSPVILHFHLSETTTASPTPENRANIDQACLKCFFLLNNFIIINGSFTPPHFFCIFIFYHTQFGRVFLRHFGPAASLRPPSRVVSVGKDGTAVFNLSFALRLHTPTTRQDTGVRTEG